MADFAPTPGNAAEDTPSKNLQALAEAHGVATEFWGYSGTKEVVSQSTIRTVLGALGVNTTSDDDVMAALAEVDLGPWRTVVPSCVVARADEDHHVPVHVLANASVSVRVNLSGGERVKLASTGEVEHREVDGQLVERHMFVIPAGLKLGWHQLVVSMSTSRPRRVPVAICPGRLESTAGSDRAWGLMAQLYSVRSAKSWGLGDLADLEELSGQMADSGADFVLVNPLHAAEPVAPISASPYLPVSRRFVNPIYIRPEEIKEAAYLTGPQRSILTWAVEEVRPANSENTPLDRDAVWSAKSEALDVIFSLGRSPARQKDFDRFRAREGGGLEDFALWCALTEKYRGQTWPSGLEDPTSPRVSRARHELHDRVDFWAWLQWIADQQLADVQRTATEAGMSLGVMHDLAVGVHPESADVWSAPEAFARGIGVGAPPDMYNQQGQNWSQPPWRPDVLEASAYQPLRAMLGSVLRHAGAIRIDHIMGLFRLWWIPDGSGPGAGTYVRYNHEAMVGILLLEAHLAGAAVIGEDLGTVEPWVREYLESRGVLGTSVMWFEKDDDGHPRRPEDYRRNVLATVDTHDLPPVAGYLAEEHVDLRERLGLLNEPAAKVRADAAKEREQTVARLQEYDLVGQDPTEREVLEALHVYVAQAPSKLMAVSLTDAVGERRTQNQPGTDREYPNWKIPLADGTENVVLLEDLPSHPRAQSLLEQVDRTVRRFR